MILIIGGCEQGKLDYALQHFNARRGDVFTCDAEGPVDLSRRVIEHIERFALGCVRRGESPEAFWQANMDRLTDKVLIADDISCGVVPADPQLRAWREASGRANLLLAGRADRVVRVFCGLGLNLK